MKTRVLCKYFPMGTCTRGSRCRFAHKSDLLQLEDKQDVLVVQARTSKDTTKMVLLEREPEVVELDILYA